ncbi:MAG: hypothetical protein Q7W13_04950 [Bacteroidia bacterium]|nr:hypothetical protein [Bacteroidia bacterium]
MKKIDEISMQHYGIGKVLSSKEKKNAVHSLKNELSYNILSQVVEALDKTVKPLSFTIYGSALPDKLEDLGKCDLLYKPESLENEVKWVLLSIKKYAKELSLFLILKNDFENAFLLGNYEKAEQILEVILKETGFSLWYIEAKFLLLEYQNKSEEQKLFLSEIYEINKNGLIGTLSHFLSQRTERNLSAYKYDYDIDNLFRFNKNKEENDGRARYRFRLNFFESYQLNDYSFIVLFENKNSIIDRYLILVSVLKILFLQDDRKEFVFLKSRYIYRKTNDNSLLPILYGVSPQLNNKEYFDEKYIRILDLYYSGFYEDAISECSKYLLKNTKHFDLLIIYSKCHVNLKREFLNITLDQGTLINQLGLKIFNLISNKANRKDLLYNLYQINKNILSFDIATGLNYFLKKEQNFIANKNLKLLSNFLFDPYFSVFYKTEDTALQYLQNGTVHFANSISIKYWKTLINNEISNDSEISNEISLIDNAKILFKQNKYEESIIEWNKIVSFFSGNAPILQTALKYWFESLVKLENYNDAIQFFVDEYLKDTNSINKINSIELVMLLRKQKYKGIKRTIELPIFVGLNSNDDLEKSFILEQYCKIFFKKTPSELFEDNLDSNLGKVELFYNDICTLETLKHSIYINTTIDRLTERQKIINHLIEINPLKKKYFQEELNLVSNELIIYEGTQKLEESKIYANDQAIINYELNDIDGLFKRYKTIYNLSLRDKKILVITKSSYALYKFDDKNKYNETDVKYSDSALLEVFSELYDLILDKYLFSKFGIVAYLSTRIRHGVLLGEIRPEIEKQNLILSRIGSSSEYEKSKFWNKTFFNLSEIQKNKLHDILSKFSLKIDTIIEDIIREKIQIKKDGKNIYGLFNYEFDKTELYSFANELATETDAKLFCQKVIDLIWKRTDANLEVIRSYIDNDIKNQFSEELNNLDSELGFAFRNNQLPQIFTNVVECTTIIETKLNKISSWFRRSGSSINDFDIQKLFNIVWLNTVRCYPKISAECNIKLDINPTIKSTYYLHFTDLFRILLDNMFKYGASKNEKKQFDFFSKEENGFLICSFINLKENDSDPLPLESKDGQLIINTNKLISESKSGISKAIKIVKYDLDNENNFIRIETDNSEKFILDVAIEIKNLIQK